MSDRVIVSNINQSLIFRPGSRRPIAGHRAQWAERLLAGRAPDAAATMLPALYALCGQAHRLCASLAVAAASGQPLPACGTQARALVQETVREHIRRIWLDWPQRLRVQLGGTSSALSELADCPLLDQRIDGGPNPREWIERSVLGMNADAWLARWSGDPAAWLADWCSSSRTWPAQVLSECRAQAQARVVGRPLLVHRDASQLQRLARQIAADETFASFPTWDGSPCETGCWTRLRAEVPAQRIDTAWLRAAARVAELAALARTLSDDAPAALDHGAVSTGANEALAWCEMSRGLLIHWVRLDRTENGTAIARYRVIAPTEWNCHPQGAFATYLRGMTAAPDATALARIDTLAAAYDPCVPYVVETAATSDEALHHA